MRCGTRPSSFAQCPNSVELISMMKIEMIINLIFNLVLPSESDSQCLKPDGLQAEIDRLVEQFNPGARSFVRASGTENVVRVYAESSTQEAADRLSHLVGEKVIEFCNK